ncbi:MAG: divalent-cation tolerance protein CutA [Candidatus Omnitrophica bacterium]|nr:divalent-cation tolerance protein CutA [Candidatus Omnitrophota bacterium]
MTQVVVVLVTCPNAAAGRRLGRELVRKRLAACVNLIPRIESCYRWQGKVERSPETLLIIKTASRRFAALQRAIRALHPYECPEIVALPVSAGHPPYLRWILESAT